MRDLEGKTIAEIAMIRGDSDPADTCFDLILEEGDFVPGVHHNMSQDDVDRIMALPWVAIASDGTALRPDGVLGEGIPHPRSYGTFPRVLGKYVREDGVLTLEAAVRKMSAFSAEILGLEDRGVLVEGNWADVVVFDPQTVSDRGTFEEPEQFPVGIEYVLVNGILVIENGEHTGAKPGKAILNKLL
jgi:N-acyl-D-amino-acid deacylase